MSGVDFLNPAHAVALAGVAEGMKVADFDAGAGFFTRAAARAVGPGGVVWASDPRRELLLRIKGLAVAEGLHNVEIIQGDAEKDCGTKLPDGAFDFCIVANVLFAAERRDALAREAARVLKNGGKALVIDWRGSFGGLGPAESHIIEAAQAKRTFEQAHFNFEKEIQTGGYHWGLVFRKKSAQAAQ